MYNRKDKAVVLDLWFEGPSGMSVESFVGQPGWPSPATMRRWIMIQFMDMSSSLPASS